jgi:hypothetical protein
MEVLKKFDSFMRENTKFLENKYVTAGIMLFLILYAGLAAPRLPLTLFKLFDLTIVKAIMFFLIIYISSKDQSVALITAIGLIVTLMALEKLKINFEMLTIVGKPAIDMTPPAPVIQTAPALDVPPDTNEKLNNDISMEELSEEVVRRKIAMGRELSPDELRGICVSVMNEHGGNTAVCDSMVMGNDTMGNGFAGIQ